VNWDEVSSTVLEFEMRCQMRPQGTPSPTKPHDFLY
jgi:hypothetical protein